MVFLLVLALGRAISDVNLSFLISIAEPNQQMSPEDDQKAKEIAKRVTDKQNKCFDHLDKSYQQLCENLDVQKRINLSAATLYCEHQLDRRSDKLPFLDENPDLRNYSLFGEELDDDTFALFTTLFISVDSICFHATHEAQSTANIHTMESIFHASEIAAAYIKDSGAKLENITKDVVGKLGDVYGAMNETELKITGFQNRVVGIIDQFNSLTEKAKYYRNSVANMKFYVIGIVFGFFMNLVIPNVFVPTIAVTALYLLLECNIAKETAEKVTGNVFKWSYAVVVALIQVVGVWNVVRPFQVKLLGKRRELKIPARYSAPPTYRRY